MLNSKFSRRLGGILLLFILMFSTSMSLKAELGNDGVVIKFNKDYKLKRSSNVVTVSGLDSQGDAVSYDFTEFSADVLLSVYRNMDLQLIIKKMSDKYHLSKTESRRKVKMTLNTLASWSIIIRN